MIDVVNNLFRLHLRKYQYELELHYERPIELQEDTFESIIVENEQTEFGRKYQFTRRNPQYYSKSVPVATYDDLWPYIKRSLYERDGILTQERVRALAKTAGTTSGKSKYIPVTKQNLVATHQYGGWVAMAALYSQKEDLKIFAKKNLLIGGGLYGNYPDTDVLVGDISAILIQSLPLVVRPFYIPDVKTATLPDYEQKIKRIAELGAKETSITMLGGVPTWNLTLYRQILELTGASNLLEIWPDLQAYVHGGVSFAPYRCHFRELIPSDTFLYQEVYNASEGFFAIQDQLDRDDMLLLLSNGIYYEFIPFQQFKAGNHQAIPLADVQLGETYALVITTNAGLYRYLIGDLVTISSVKPYRIKIVGRTKEYINAFGEDLLVENAEQALMSTCRLHHATINEYTIAPFYLRVNERGRHQWFIEFEVPPGSMPAFAGDLDRALQRENSNYEQKRTNDFAIDALEVIDLPSGFFKDWLRTKGKIGGQNKVPKLANHRQYAEEILELLGQPG